MGGGFGVVVPLVVRLDVVFGLWYFSVSYKVGVVAGWWNCPAVVDPSRMGVAAAGGCTASGSVGVAVNVVVDLSGVSLSRTSLLSLAGNCVRLWWAPSRMGAAAAGGCAASGFVGVSGKVVVDLVGVSL